MNDISYVNAVMYSRAMPMVGDKSPENKADYEDSLDANVVGRFDDFEEDEIIVRK